MVDFRKWLLALAGVGLLLGLGSSAANAQQINCGATTAVNNVVRAEGITELLGDLVLNCTSTANATAFGQNIPQVNFQLSINTNITSRIVGAGSISEAVMTIDEPYPTAGGGTPAPPVGPTPVAANNAFAQLGCVANNNTNCRITSLGAGSGNTGNYNGTAGHYNVFQGVQSSVNTISWSGVPVDPPGTSGARVIRFTNIRANAFQLGVSSTLVPTQIVALVSVNGSSTVNITQPSGAVGTVEPGLLQPPSVALGGVPGAASYTQCTSVNTYLIPTPATSPTDTGIVVSATEGFPYSFKPQNFAQLETISHQYVATSAADYVAPGNPTPQDIPGYNYNTESGFTPVGNGFTFTGTEDIGFADHGTQIQFTVSGVSSGVSLYAPPYIYLQGSYGGGSPVGVAVLVSQTAGSSGAVTGSSSIPVAFSPAATMTSPGGGNTTTPNPAAIAISSSGTTTTLVYEIYYSDPAVTETLAVPISVEYVSNTGSNIPAATTTPTTVGVEFSPQSTVTTASSSAPIPRFGPSGSPQSLFTISPCSCNLLFPFVTNIAGFDTGVAIANTSSDPFGTSPQTGTVTLNYYGTTSGGGAAPPKAVSSAIAGGQELIFTVSNGGNFGIAATPGFEGYIIAQANFQFCHGFAFISDVGAQKLAEGYLAIQLDQPFSTSRTHNSGENKGN